jgi:copper transporter 1
MPIGVVLVSFCFLTLTVPVTVSHDTDLHGLHDGRQLQTDLPRDLGSKIQRHTLETANSSARTPSLEHHLPTSSHQDIMYPHMDMMMYFHVSRDTVLFFEDWNLNSAGSTTGAIMLLFIMAAAFECLKWFREYLKIKFHKKMQKRTCVNCKKSAPTTTNRSDCTSGKCVCQQPERLPILENITRSLLQVVQLFTSYALMLAVMTYNIWLVMAVVLGSGLGYFIAALHVPKHLVIAAKRGQCCC